LCAGLEWNSRKLIGFVRKHLFLVVEKTVVFNGMGSFREGPQTDPKYPKVAAFVRFALCLPIGFTYSLKERRGKTVWEKQTFKEKNQGGSRFSRRSF